MNRNPGNRRNVSLTLVLAAAALLAACEHPPVETVQGGYRGLAMTQVNNPRTVARQRSANTVPDALPLAPADGPRAAEVFKNVKVLGDLSVTEFTRVMTAVTAWVAPEQGCAYCHAAGEDLSADTLYTKVVSRRMLEMTRHINTDWKSHVAGTGVTCYTCHRGKNVPSDIWFAVPERAHAENAGNPAGQNAPSSLVALASLPNDPLSTFLRTSNEIRVVSTTAIPGGNPHNIKETEATYGLMMHMSQSLGVNCTYCHNTRSFASWDLSTPKRATAWYGIRLARDLNGNYLEPLKASFPHNRLGALGDAPKVSCATCHKGAYKPLLGASMIKDYPELAGVRPAPVPAVTVGDPSASGAAATNVPAGAAQ